MYIEAFRTSTAERAGGGRCLRFAVTRLYRPEPEKFDNFLPHRTGAAPRDGDRLGRCNCRNGHGRPMRATEAHESVVLKSSAGVPRLAG